MEQKSFQMLWHHKSQAKRRFGGVVPEIASRHHVEQITLVIEEALAKAELKPAGA